MLLTLGFSVKFHCAMTCCVAINAKEGDCWIQLFEGHCWISYVLSLMSHKSHINYHSQYLLSSVGQLSVSQYLPSSVGQLGSF